MKKRLLIITGDDGYLTTKLDGAVHQYYLSQVNVDKIEVSLKKSFEVERCTYSSLDLNRDFSDYYVIYGSTEERGLFYKGYVEDVIYRMMLDGAVLIPKYEFAKAYGNKGFQEILRRRFSKDINNLDSWIIGRLYDLKTKRFTKYPYVVKASAGSGSGGVCLVKSPQELERAVRRLSKTIFYDYEYSWIRDIGYLDLPRKFKIWLYEKLKRSQRMTDPRKWFNANSVVVQEYIEGLDYDYKVLYYYGKYYVLKRLTRKNDFRASGSGKFTFPQRVNEIQRILDFAEKCALEFDVPMVSLDIASSGRKEYLIEFQCLGFGPYTIQFSNWYFVKEKNIWKRIDGRSDLETEIARSYIEYLLQK